MMREASGVDEPVQVVCGSGQGKDPGLFQDPFVDQWDGSANDLWDFGRENGLGLAMTVVQLTLHPFSRMLKPRSADVSGTVCMIHSSISNDSRSEVSRNSQCTHHRPLDHSPQS